jgi:hypothetical protein
MKGTMRKRRQQQQQQEQPAHTTNSTITSDSGGDWEARIFLLKDGMLIWFKHAGSKHCQGALDLTFASILPPKLDSPGNALPLWSFRLQAPLTREATGDQIIALRALAEEVDDLLERGQLDRAEAALDRLDALQRQSHGMVAPITFELQCNSLLEREAWVLSLAETIEATQPKSARQAAQAAALDYSWALCSSSGSCDGGGAGEQQLTAATAEVAAALLERRARSSSSQYQHAAYAERLSKATAGYVHAAEARQEEELMAQLAHTQRQIAAAKSGGTGSSSVESQLKVQRLPHIEGEIDVLFAKINQKASAAASEGYLLMSSSWECAVAKPSRIVPATGDVTAAPEQFLFFTIELQGVNEHGNAVDRPDEACYGVMVTAIAQHAHRPTTDPDSETADCNPAYMPPWSTGYGLVGRVIRLVDSDPVAGLSYAQTVDAILAAERRPLQLSFISPSFVTSNPPLHTMSCGPDNDEDGGRVGASAISASSSLRHQVRAYVGGSSDDDEDASVIAVSSTRSQLARRQWLGAVDVHIRSVLLHEAEVARTIASPSARQRWHDAIAAHVESIHLQKQAEEALEKVASQRLGIGQPMIGSSGSDGTVEHADMRIDPDLTVLEQHEQEGHGSEGEDEDDFEPVLSTQTPGYTPLRRLSEQADALLAEGDLDGAEEVLDRVEDLQDIRDSFQEENYAGAELRKHYRSRSTSSIGDSSSCYEGRGRGRGSSSSVWSGSGSGSGSRPGSGSASSTGSAAGAADDSSLMSTYSDVSDFELHAETPRVDPAVAAAVLSRSVRASSQYYVTGPASAILSISM